MHSNFITITLLSEVLNDTSLNKVKSLEKLAGEDDDLDYEALGIHSDKNDYHRMIDKILDDDNSYEEKEVIAFIDANEIDIVLQTIEGNSNIFTKNGKKVTAKETTTEIMDKIKNIK